MSEALDSLAGIIASVTAWVCAYLYIRTLPEDSKRFNLVVAIVALVTVMRIPTFVKWVHTL